MPSFLTAEPSAAICDSQQTARLNVLFWNVNGEIDLSLLAKMVDELDVSLLCLAESTIDNAELLNRISARGDRHFKNLRLMTPKLTVITRSDIAGDERYSDINGRLSVLGLKVAKQEFLFAAVHLQSMNNTDEKDRFTEACIVADQIRAVEEEHSNNRTILCGDLNMNPFSDGVVAAKAFHAIADRRIVQRGARVVQNREYPFFYNPMWNFLGDETDGPPGTLYYRHSGHVSYEWNMFDQVLIRPQCLGFYRGVSVLTESCGISLAKKSGRPNRKKYSDHFPLLINFEVPNA
ncbi:endonuclease/exonuclease/phosphatase family protein [Novipirellula rosea]|uniref:Endonuclease/exonuclease/phosphatase domain-containing protein n=1 Tax=Novipirellula rosea TaxID=1031540 RepID=A0ABP8NBE3_9BACT